MPLNSNRPVPLALKCLWGAHIVLVPFYAFDSGLPQPADALALLAAVGTFLSGGIGFGPLQEHVLRMVAATWYCVVVGVFHSLFSQDETLLRVPAFYVYNALVACSVAQAYVRYREAFLGVLFRSVVAAVVLQVVLIPVAAPSQSARATLFFNNPNQLGYFAVVSASMLVLISRDVRRQPFLQILGLACCVLLAIISLSKASIAAISALLIMVFVRRPAVVLLLMAILGVAYALMDVGDLSDNLHTRLTVRQGDDGLAGRGYDRIAQYAQYLLFGAGEAGFDRFELQFRGEIHSSFGTMIFSYGALGSLLLSAFFYGVARLNPPRALVALCPIALYGLTHNGLRSTIAWEYVILVACLVAMPPRAVLIAPAKRTGHLRMK